MRLIDEFRDAALIAGLRARLAGSSIPPARLMEVCGTHTMAIAHYGIRSLLPPQVKLVSGPGCPVCVTHQRDIDAFISLADLPNIVLTTFGDMLRVPGSNGSLEARRAQGADVRVVYSPMDAVRIAQAEPHRQVVFLGIGFETTAPTVAASLLEAWALGLRNFTVLSAHKLIPPALRMLATAPDLRIDGFILPGHVSAITGLEPYRFLVDECRKPCVVTGFEPLDLAQGISMLLAHLGDGEPALDIQYSRVVRPEGNAKAREVVDRVFEPTDAAWRGMGVLPDSGLAIRPQFAELDAAKRFAGQLQHVDAHEPPGCLCGCILKGAAEPSDCQLFGTRCTPASPVGPCMVSSEGTCAAHYRYLR